MSIARRVQCMPKDRECVDARAEARFSGRRFRGCPVPLRGLAQLAMSIVCSCNDDAIHSTNSVVGGALVVEHHVDGYGCAHTCTCIDCVKQQS